MVFFICERCGESQKKNQVEKHNFRCHSNAYSCMDCSLLFRGEAYKGHLQCISEDQKYGGKNFVAKENKGETKQADWTAQVERAIDKVGDAKLKPLLEQIRGFGNIPRKQAKFINFLQNSLRIRNHQLCTRIWQAIESQAKTSTAVATDGTPTVKPQANGTEDTNKAVGNKETSEAVEDNEAVEVNGDAETKKKSKKRKLVEDQEVEAVQSEEMSSVKNDKLSSNDTRQFKWKSAIKLTLKRTDGTMRLKKLEKVVISQYREDTTDHQTERQQLTATFRQKLQKIDKLLIQGKSVQLSM